MKKKHKYGAWNNRALKKMFLIMRLTIVILLAFIFQSFALETYSQNTRISISVSQTKLVDILNQIENESKYRFAYNKNEINVEKYYSVDLQDADITSVLNRLFSDGKIKYSLIGRQIVLYPSNEMGFQQNVSVNGRVVDSSGAPLPGVTIVVKGTTTGTVTDADGNYVLNDVPGNATLVYSFVGMEPQEIQLEGKTKVDVKMRMATTGIEEVVAIGYGTQKKVNLTGSVETVTFGDKMNQPVSNSAQLMYGRFSGVQLTQTSGNPGADNSSIVIRGINTFSDSKPLVVIDNIQYDDLAVFNNLAPSDIESVTVLKDASASAIYGARGANGVILVTTKSGKADKFEVDINSYYGFQKATVVPKFLGSYDYATLMNEKYLNEDGPGFIPRYTDAQLEAIKTGSLPDQFANTDWPNVVLRTSPITNQNISFTGGNKKTTYRFSLGYFNQESIIKSSFKANRYSLNLHLDSKLKDWVELTNVTNAYWRSNTGPEGGQDALTGDNGIIYQFQRAAPTIPVYYSNGDYGMVDGAYQGANASFGTNNPIRRGYLGHYAQDIINFSERVGLKLKLTKHISFETSGSAIIGYSQVSDFHPTELRNDWDGNVVNLSTLNSLMNSTNLNYDLLNENLLRYENTWNSNHFGVLLGQSASFYKTDGFSGQLSGFPTDNLEEFDAGGVVEPAVSGSAAEDAQQSFFGRINYDYNGKYLAEFAMRRDGSSKFGSGHRYGNFPSASVGWRISEEDFFNVDFISNLKLRASWGLSGNDRIGRYIYSQTYNPNIDYVLGDDATVVGVAQTSLANPSIKWEETEQYDIGLDASFNKGKIEFVGDYFKRNSRDILYNNFPIPATLGVSSLGAQNAASMVSEGLELSLNYRNNFGDVEVAFGGNITKFLNNKVTGLGKGGEETITGTSIIRIGEPFQAYYGYKEIGIFQDDNEVANSPVQFGDANTAPGDMKYADLSGPDGVPDGIVDAYDRTVIGNPNPNFLYNLNGSIDYKNFDFSFLFQGVQGVDRLLMGNGNGPMGDNRSNVLTYWINRWTPEKPSTIYPRVGGQNNGIVSSFYIYDASYLRLKNVEIGYTLPKSISERIKIARLRIYVSGQNQLTFSKLKNFDPEGASGNHSNRNVPLYKTMTLGLNLKF